MSADRIADRTLFKCGRTSLKRGGSKPESPDGSALGRERMVAVAAINSLDKTVDEDIVKILDEISDKSANEYKMYCDDGGLSIVKTVLELIKRTTGKTAKDLIIDMVGPAEEFYTGLARLVPKNGILQHRIGLDYTTKIPTTLTVISKEYESKLPEIMDMAADLEISIFRKTDNYCSFWVITDHSLDQYSINHDFPCYKVNI